MIIYRYILNKFIKTIFLCFLSIFSLVGNLNENISFYSIILLSLINSFQIFVYIPSYLIILSLIILLILLKSKNELLIIKEYLSINRTIIVLIPIILFFIIFDLNKNHLNEIFNNIKSKFIINENNNELKIIYNKDENKEIFRVLKNIDTKEKKIGEYLFFNIQNQKIILAEYNINTRPIGDKIISQESFHYKDDSFTNFLSKEIIFENIFYYIETTKKYFNLNEKQNKKNSIIDLNQYFFISLFYLIATLIIFKKKMVDRNLSLTKISLTILTIFFYYLIINEIHLNNYDLIFQLISTLTLLTIFFNLKKNE